MAHPDLLAGLGWGGRHGPSLGFDLGLGLAFVATCFLVLRWVVRITRLSRSFSLDPALRGVQGTVMAEFALVLPITLLLIGTVIQIALISHAAIVVHYAAFAAARSAMVSFNSGLTMIPFFETVDTAGPEKAAHTVLATISPPGATAHPDGNGIAAVLAAQSSAWDGGRYQQRMGYASQATTLTTNYSYISGTLNQWIYSLPPLVPRVEHLVEPAAQWSRDEQGYLPAPEQFTDVIPKEFKYTLELPAPLPTIPITIPAPPPISNLIDSANGIVNQALKGAIHGIATGVGLFAQEETINVDPFSPKEVEVSLKYKFRLAIPSLFNFLPGLTEPAPEGVPGRAFELQYHAMNRVGNHYGSTKPGHPDYFTVRLQSTGGRTSLLSAFPWVYDITAGGGVWNTPLYWVPSAPSPDPPKGKKKNP